MSPAKHAAALALRRRRGIAIELAGWRGGGSGRAVDIVELGRVLIKYERVLHCGENRLEELVDKLVETWYFLASNFGASSSPSPAGVYATWKASGAM